MKINIDLRIGKNTLIFLIVIALLVFLLILSYYDLQLCTVEYASQECPKEEKFTIDNITLNFTGYEPLYKIEWFNMSFPQPDTEWDIIDGELCYKNKRSIKAIPHDDWICPV